MLKLQAIEAYHAFRSMVQAKTKELKITKVFNADQTGKTKERVAVMLLGDSDGNKFDPFLVNKTKLSKIAETARENTATHHGFERLLCPEPDWGSIYKLLHAHEIPTDAIDATKDIEKSCNVYEEATV
ncbi:hypothetical protein AM587_10010764 [Phytophthora nicotianae]|uniref:Uncharacterized protein n=1 Tax=Phytophthora nicotianae TaxID=4792 RepID=A0A0W8DNE6_PHYNI|nr:hypothetical protein AM587_10010764 [Phytophthora nicotianae]